jgi:ABC-type bacteriocin/lantibiotic exporter with double-glycine peptidase domain
MTHPTDTSDTAKPVDSGLDCLVIMARIHAIAADADQLSHEFKKAEGQPFGQTEILLAAKKLGLQASVVKTPLERLDKTPLPHWQSAPMPVSSSSPKSKTSKSWYTTHLQAAPNP